MKFWWFFLILIFNVSIANSEVKNWYFTNTVTLSWNANLEITLSDGTKQVIPTEEISYKVFCVSSTNPDKNNPILVTQTNESVYKLSNALEVLQEGSYLFGVQMIRNQEGKEPMVSPIGWSDNPQNLVSPEETFGIFVFNTPNIVKTLFIKTDFTAPAPPEDVIAE